MTFKLIKEYDYPNFYCPKCKIGLTLDSEFIPISDYSGNERFKCPNCYSLIQVTSRTIYKSELIE